MTTASLAMFCLWLLAAAAAGLLPPRWERRPSAAALVATGVPILGFLTWLHGPMVGLLALGLGVMLLWRPLPQEARGQDHPAE